MAQLVPPNTDLSALRSEAERVIVEALLRNLDESWWVTTNVRVKVGGDDVEIDVVAACPSRGVIVGEVKGGVIDIVDGAWQQNGSPFRNDPVEQVTAAKHGLVRRLKAMKIDHGLWIEHMLMFPDVHNVPDDGIGTAVPREYVLDGSLLGFAQHAFNGLLREREPVTTAQFHAFMSALKPTMTLGGSEGRASPAALKLLDQNTIDHLDALRALGDNQEVLVTGGPGTGKTWLIIDWARRAIGRGERTAVVCFNRPIAERLSAELAGTGVLVSTYHALIMEHLLPHLELQPPATEQRSELRDWWDTVPTRALLEQTAQLRERFDTIIIDEGQDLRRDWLKSLRLTLDPDGPNRVLITADPVQAIYTDPDDLFDRAITVQLPLTRNLRATRNIGNALHHLGRAISAHSASSGSIPTVLDSAPRGPKVAHRLAGGSKEMVKRVRARIHELVVEFAVPHSEILVLTTAQSHRDALIGSSDEELSLVRWEQAEEGTVICETAHRAKGLEATAVIVVAVEDAPDLQLLYVAASRAIWSLTLVGPRSLPELFGI